MKTILVPTDFSDHALYALKVAANIAKKINAEIKLVHVNNLPLTEFAENKYYTEFYEQEIKAAEEKLNNLLEVDFLKEIKVSKHIVSNILMWELVKNDKYKNVDLIVIGSHGKSGFQNAFIGSNTEKIVRMAEAPVLTIKNEHKVFNIKSMVFASDFFSESYSVFKKIKFFADLYKVRTYLLKVITSKNFEPTSVSRKLMEDFAKEFKLKESQLNIYNATSIEKGIIDFSNEINANLIAIETHGRTGISYLINGSLAEDIANHIDRPVLSIKIKGDQKYASKTGDYPNNFTNWGAE
jgi:nucleotide-binding universal stress UspA family protein